MPDAYITQAELRIEPYEISHEKVDNKYLAMLQELTVAMITNFCGQDFFLEGTVETPVVKMLNGTGKDTIFLPKRLVSLTEVRDYDDIDDWETYEESLFIKKPKYLIWNQFGEVTARSIVGEPGIFTEGKGNIGVVGTWGWPAVPTAIKYLQGKLIKKVIDDKSFSNKFSSESIGDYSYSLRNDNITPITGDAELDMIIRQYRQWVVYGVI